MATLDADDLAASEAIVAAAITAAGVATGAQVETEADRVIAALPENRNAEGVL